MIHFLQLYNFVAVHSSNLNFNTHQLAFNIYSKQLGIGHTPAKITTMVNSCVWVI